ncbi:SDR family oxidoreductase [Deinococcus aquiradiocola]|uniref:Short-chain dehydrogenase/reductase n=1 Tax=Deinococcus aquiradiocola TaxID=393059 RepID=A0A917P9C9_9DEIO|nr:SDR family oxidoreductase [Deinococcus aquiradiocola]GGJ67559.1 short-chain dehydrogenase/reductase [Deinococcus aquiradiocola]
MPNTIFITGASTGLGHATALLFAQRGWNVIATMRDPAAAPDLAAHAQVTVLPLDVTKPEQVQDAARRALELEDVDVLFNNAGYGLAGPFEGASDEQLVRQLDTNLLGVMRVTQAFLPHFRTRGAGVIVTTTSIGGLVTFPFNSVYHATKWALEGWSESLAFELKPFGVRVKTVAPGGIRTDFAGRSIVVTQHDAYADALGKTMAAFSKPERQGLGSSAEQIAEIVWEAVTDGEDRVRYVAGRDAQATYAQREQVGAETFRKGVAQAFLGE